MYTNRRHNAKVWIRTGVKQDGTLMARECWIDLDTGAYADNGPRVAARAATTILGPYRCPHGSIRSRAVYTNKSPAGSFRAIGSPQVVWPLESQMDRIAEELRLDPVEVRRKNLLRQGELWFPGRKPMDADLASSLDKVVSAVGWSSSARSQAAGTTSAKAIAWGIREGGAFPAATALVRMHFDGTITVQVGTTEIGQGAKTVFSQIVAEETTLPLSEIQVVSPDTELVPYDRSTGASRSTTVTGSAVQAAAVDLVNQIRSAASDLLSVPIEQISLEGSRVRGGGQDLTFPAVIEHHFGARGGELIGRGYVRRNSSGQRFQSHPLFYEVGITGVSVEVDAETGQIHLRHLASVADAGKAINPVMVESQEEGAAMMGIGHTLFEELFWEGGQLVNSNLVDYRVPTFAELPDRFETIVVENGDGPGPYGARGVGEGGLMAVAPAVGNALARVLGVRFHDLPLTPERVWKVLRERAGNRTG